MEIHFESCDREMFWELAWTATSNLVIAKCPENWYGGIFWTLFLRDIYGGLSLILLFRIHPKLIRRYTSNPLWWDTLTLERLTDYLDRDGITLHEALYSRYYVCGLADILALVVIRNVVDMESRVRSSDEHCALCSGQLLQPLVRGWRIAFRGAAERRLRVQWCRHQAVWAHVYYLRWVCKDQHQANNVKW